MEEAERFIIIIIIIISVGGVIIIIIIPWNSFNGVKEVNRDLCECCMNV